jgi:hypothetical protein
MVRVTFGKKWTNAGPVAKAISEALKRTYPTVAFRTRYRTATTYISLSWVECAWPGPPNEAEATAVISVALRKVRL